MKNLLLFFFLFVSTFSYAQVFVNKIDINNRYLQYVEVWEKPISDAGKYFAMVDYGQMNDSKGDKAGDALILTNAKGKKMEFNGIVDALNYMYRNGWEVLQPKNIDGYESFIMKRRDGYIMPTEGMSKTN